MGKNNRKAIVNGVLRDPIRYAKSLRCVWKTYPSGEIVPLIGYEERMFVVEFEGVTYTANCVSLRLLNFKRSLMCVHCGRVGTQFRAEASRSDSINCKNPHLNLYSDDDVLMTHDHILPRSKGGWNDLDNTQTMCAECNCLKGDSMVDVRYICDDEGRRIVPRDDPIAPGGTQHARIIPSDPSAG